MPQVFLAALAASLFFHAAALWLPDVELSTVPADLPALTAELQPPPKPPVARLADASRPRQRPARLAPVGKPAIVNPAPVAEPAPLADASASDPEVPQAGGMQERAEETERTAAGQAAGDGAGDEAGEAQDLAALPDSRLPGRGYIRFDVHKGSQGLLVGRAEHRWEFSETTYRLLAVTETVGLAALLKPVNIELESQGQLTAAGLQPERFSTRRNGGGTRENADFDWEGRQLTLERDGSRHYLPEGAQDLLSFHYQFGYLATPGEGAAMGVASGRKYEHYRFQAIGEEEVETPAGQFRTLHLKVRTDSTTELWLALDHLLLPVKIRYTDRKGDSFEQVATELGI